MNMFFPSTIQNINDDSFDPPKFIQNHPLLIDLLYSDNPLHLPPIPDHHDLHIHISIPKQPLHPEELDVSSAIAHNISNGIATNIDVDIVIDSHPDIPRRTVQTYHQSKIITTDIMTSTEKKTVILPENAKYHQTQKYYL